MLKVWKVLPRHHLKLCSLHAIPITNQILLEERTCRGRWYVCLDVYNVYLFSVSLYSWNKENSHKLLTVVDSNELFQVKANWGLQLKFNYACLNTCACIHKALIFLLLYLHDNVIFFSVNVCTCTCHIISDIMWHVHVHTLTLKNITVIIKPLLCTCNWKLKGIGLQ